jgi:hypothetical protein
MRLKNLLKKYGITKMRDLARLLCSNPRSAYYGKNEISIRSFLSQILNGGRKAPIDLKDSIINCLMELSTQYSQAELVNQLDDAFETWETNRASLANKGLSEVRISQNGDYDLLLRCIKDAVTISVITAEPAEVKNNILADKLKNELLKKVGIIKSDEKKAIYKFYLSHGSFDNTPLDFWEGLYKYAIEQNVPDIEGKFIEANEEYLKVFVIPDYEVDVMHGIIDENLPQQISFITIYNKIKMSNIEEMSVIREENENLSRILRRLQALRNRYNQEFSFADALKIINR